MKLDLLGGSYQEKYKEFNSQRTINWYPVVGTQQEKDKSPTALYPTPGLTAFVTPAGRYNRGIFTARTIQGTRCFTVVDTTLWEISANGSLTNRGTLSNLGTGSTKVWMIATLNNELGIFHYNASYVFNMTTNTLTQITTNQFPGLASTVTYLDGYVAIVSAGSVFFTLVTGSNLLTWVITNTYSPTYRPAPVINAVALREEIYNFTSETIEIYINDGTTPYSRLPRSTIKIGLAAKESVATFDGGFLFLGKTDEGEVSVYFFDSYYSTTQTSPFSVSQALNDILNNGTEVADAYSFIQYTKDGHVLYYLTIPSIKTTFVYDVMTKMWHERQSQNPVNDSDGGVNYGQFRGRHFTSFAHMNLFTDLYSSTVFKEDYNNQTESNTPIIRTRISQTFSQDYQNISAASFELDGNAGYGTLSGQGSNPILMLSYSKDGGYNYSPPRNMLLGTTGNHLFRLRKQKLGTARNWTIKMVVSDPVDIMIQNAIVRGDTGVS